MHIDNLPASVPIAISADSSILTIALQLVLPPRSEFLYHGPISGAPRSGRLFTLVETPGLIPARHAPSSFWAEQLVMLTPNARYSVPAVEGGVRAWEIRLTKVGYEPAAIAWATWLV